MNVRAAWNYCGEEYILLLLLDLLDTAPKLLSFFFIKLWSHLCPPVVVAPSLHYSIPIVINLTDHFLTYKKRKTMGRSVC